MPLLYFILCVESAQSCGGELSESEDTFGIMLIELEMGSMTACHWVINNEQMQTLELKIFRLHLPNDDTCTSAFIEVSQHRIALGKCDPEAIKR